MKTKHLFEKLLLLFCLYFICMSLQAQSYHNGWIDYNKTYYKFKLGPFGFDIVGAPVKTGVVRIPKSTLSAAGLGAVPADQWQLWRNGVQVPIYVSLSTGSAGSDYYIEFWGKSADGKLDTDLYKDSSYQLSDAWSLVTDSSSYFLTVNTSVSDNLRLLNTINDVQHAAMPAEKNFIYTTGRYYRSEIFNGYGIVQDGFSLYLSSYEIGEGWSSRRVHPNNCDCSQLQLPQYFGPLFADTSGAPVSLKVNMMGNTLNDRNVKLFLNGDSVAYVNMGYYASSKTVITGIAANKVKGDSALIIVQDISDNPSDEMRVAQIELTYSHKFNFGNTSSFEFNVPASASGRYLKITNFSGGAAAPILYDLGNGKRYKADITVPDTLRFLLQPSQKSYHLVLVRADGSTAKIISSLRPRNFINYTNTSNQANYLIISNPLIYGSGTSNYVEQYRAYRNTADGGSYNAKIFDIEQLEDQFAFGTKMHPLAIKNFLRYARNNFNTPPSYAFIIGKGISYTDYRTQGLTPLIDQLNLVPTFGYPGSDNLLSAEGFNDFPETPIGRLSAASPQEVGDYLTKVKEYEAAQVNSNDSIENKSWTKKALLLTGANDAELGIQLDTFMRQYADIIGDTLFGANTITYSKTANPDGYGRALLDFSNQYNSGCGLLQYFGHSSSSSIDFNLNDPANYKNSGKYPFFIVNGCLAGNIFDFDVNRKSVVSTLSEKFVLAPQKGSIAYLSSSSYGVVNYLDIFTRQVYISSATTQYGKGLGNIVRDGLMNGLNLTGTDDYYGRMHAGQFNLHGDPALRLNTFPLPDYALQNNYTHVDPSFISAATDSFSIRVNIFNLGKAISDSVHFVLYKKYPNGDSLAVFSKMLPYIKALDSLEIKLANVPDRDTGTIIYTAIIDDANSRAELNETNNYASVAITVSTNDVRPIFPYNYAVINTPNIIFSASTANPLEQSRTYILELDTTALFNSPVKIKKTKNSMGGVISFSNTMLNQGNRVYYWRVARSGAAPHWNTFSFSYKNPGTLGFEQSHFYQHTQSDFKNLLLDSVSRTYQFAKTNTNVFVKQSIYPTSGLEDDDFSVSVNGSLVGASACVGSSIVMNVFDSLTFTAFMNTTNPFGAAPPCRTLAQINFEYSTQSAATRKNAMDFMDNYVPVGDYVVVRKIYDLGNADWAPTVWAKDTSLYGHNNSLYHRFKDQGLTIDSFIFPRTFIFIYKKNDSTHFTPVSVFSKGLYDKIAVSENIPISDSTGTITSPLFGPAKKWAKAVWSGTNINTNNRASLNIIGTDNHGNDSVFYTLDKTQSTQDISAINPLVYPYIRLEMKTSDTVTAKPYQLSAWTLEYTPVPEGAIAPNLGINIPGQVVFNHAENVKYDSLYGYVTFKNVSRVDFGKIKCALILYDSNNTAHNFAVLKTRKLPAGDTVNIAFLANVKSLPQGSYNLYFEVNSGNDQPEQYHFNNTLYKYVYIKRNVSKPAPAVSVIAGAVKEAPQAVIYPNPFRDVVKIVAPGGFNKKYTVSIFNAAGQLVIRQVFAGSIQIQTKNLASGTYIAEIQNGDYKRTWEIQKQ